MTNKVLQLPQIPQVPYSILNLFDRVTLIAGEIFVISPLPAIRYS